MCRIYRKVYSCNHSATVEECCYDPRDARSSAACTLFQDDDEASAMMCHQCHMAWKIAKCNRWDDLWNQQLLPRARGHKDLWEWLDQTKHRKEIVFTDELIPMWEQNTERGSQNTIYTAFPYHIAEIYHQMSEHINEWLATAQENTECSQASSSPTLSGSGTCSSTSGSSQGNKGKPRDKGKGKSKSSSCSSSSSHSSPGHKSKSHRSRAGSSSTSGYCQGSGGNGSGAQGYAGYSQGGRSGGHRGYGHYSGSYQ